MHCEKMAHEINAQKNVSIINQTSNEPLSELRLEFMWAFRIESLRYSQIGFQCNY